MAHQEDREERRWTIYVCPECGDALGHFNVVPYYGRCPKHPDALAERRSAGIEGEHVGTVVVIPERDAEQEEVEVRKALDTIAAWPLHERPQTRDEKAAYEMQTFARAALQRKEPVVAQHPDSEGHREP